jgi:ADP-dependent phosphofructokinase/glucokinase
MSWEQRYDTLISSLPERVAHSRLTLCGLSTVLDAVISLRKALSVSVPPTHGGQQLFNELIRRAQAGVGGELRVDWAGGASWMNEHLPFSIAVGGTGAHAARALAALGAPALLAVKARSDVMLNALGPNIFVASNGCPVPVSNVTPGKEDDRRVYIFEITAGDDIAGKSAPRSTRIIVRLSDEPLDLDEEFEIASIASAERAGAAVMSGFSILSENDLAEEVRRSKVLGQRWREAGLGWLHLELAGYDKDAQRDTVLEGLSGTVNSIGMSLSEFNSLVGKKVELKQGLLELATRFAVNRVSVHADDWAVSITAGDPNQERSALMMGCLLAACRAGAGHTVVPRGLPIGATLGATPFEESSADGWQFVTCPAPWLERPTTTLGLGDTFMAGCLLVLGAGVM